MPPTTSLLEYGLYVADVNVAAAWYRRLFDFPTLLEEGDRLRALQAGPQSVLLLFQQSASLEGVPMPTGFIPRHDGSGPVHLAFSMAPEEINAWARRLEEANIPVESTIRWPEGGTSFYFRDPDDHLLELITPRQWLIVPWPPANAGRIEA